MKLFNVLYFVFCISLLTVETQAYVFEDIVEKVNQSVVEIDVITTDKEQAMGAGVIVDSAGYIVTNAHVIEDAEKITVITPDNEEFSAKLIGADIKTDIALIKVDNILNHKSLTFGNSDEVRVGNRVFAVGNPYGLGNSVSLGIISAKERDIEKGPYDNFLQTDAAINQGNSGGALFNLKGEIIGINTAIFSTDGQSMGLGFATPSNIVKWVVSQLKENKTVIRGWLGISVGIIHSKDGDFHLVVSSMEENSPAVQAGLKVGDIIKEVGELPLNNPREFSLGVAQMAPKNILPMVIERDGKLIDFSVEVMQMPEKKIWPSHTKNHRKHRADKYKLLGIDEDKAKNSVYFSQLGMKAYYDELNKEMVITDIDEGSDLELKGVKIGDKFSTVNDKKIFGINDMKIKVKESLQKGDITMIFMQNGNMDRVVVKLSKESE